MVIIKRVSFANQSHNSEKAGQEKLLPDQDKEEDMQTKALKLRENFYWAGILDDTLRVFDIIMYTEFGTTYNSYIYKAGDKVILFETVKEKFFE